ncbi:gamma-glutamylcyclotransferase [Paraburkholderia sp. GAS334]|uniref:gamma-glutamylcyclotransferase n=1 Tax=Paraburkholderia sp. GAS334 TaxID=3035131 RepID=UPI003D1D2935
MMTRKSILSGTYLRSFADCLSEVLWTQEQIDQSLSETLKSRPANGEVWLFGYGSLIWNPLFEYDAREIATLQGWQRSFCLRVIAGRGTRETPGRMLSLEPGGSTRGVALRLPAANLDEELRLVWTREMLTGAYTPTWADVALDNGRLLKALAFVANPAHPFYESNTQVLHIAPFVAAASGLLGSNVDYVRRLQSALLNCDIKDPYIDQLATELDRLSTST